MKKSVALQTFVFVIIIIGVSAHASAAQSTLDMQKAWSCLHTKVNSSQGISLDSAMASLLAIYPEKNALNAYYAKKLTPSATTACWPNSGCTVKDTAKATLVAKRLGNDTSPMINWLSTKIVGSSDLTWFIQIMTENNGADDCQIQHDGVAYSVKIREDMKVEFGAGSTSSCLQISGTGYSVQIKNECSEKDFLVSCTKPYSANLLFTKSSTPGTIYVSSETKSGNDINEPVTLQIGVKCFIGPNGACDYESTLWAASAYKVANNDTAEFVPYLLALSQDNNRFLPNAFLYTLTANSEYSSRLLGDRGVGSVPTGMWKMSSQNDVYYDTGLALVHLGGEASSVSGLEGTKASLAQLQMSDGCWNNDNMFSTAMIIWGWKPEAYIPGESYGGLGCGDGYCNETAGETHENCPGDCKCDNNLVCNASLGETHDNCAGDCPCNFDGFCNVTANENHANCAGDCYCGNGLCETGENVTSCYADCACGNGNCDELVGETNASCATDCRCGDSTCERWESPSICPQDCSCGNHICDWLYEDATSCAGDCLGQVIPPQWIPCAQEGGACNVSCGDNEATTNNYCSTLGEVCCIGELPSGGDDDNDSEDNYDECTITGYYCGAEENCLSVGGIPYNDLLCLNVYDVCCSKDLSPSIKTCAEQDGIICEEGKTCDIDTLIASDTDVCCPAYGGECVIGGFNACEDAGGTCKVGSCEDGEEALAEICPDTNDACCRAGSQSCTQGLQLCGDGQCRTDCSTSSGGGALWIWIVILVILIGAVVLGIIYRNKLQLILFKPKGKGSPQPTGKPGSGPSPPGAGGPMRGMPARPMPTRPMPPGVARPGMPMRPMPGRPIRPGPIGKQQEREDTLEKLRKMSE